MVVMWRWWLVVIVLCSWWQPGSLPLPSVYTIILLFTLHLRILTFIGGTTRSHSFTLLFLIPTHTVTLFVTLLLHFTQFILIVVVLFVVDLPLLFIATFILVIPLHLLFTICCVRVIDKAGRRPALYTGFYYLPFTGSVHHLQFVAYRFLVSVRLPPVHATTCHTLPTPSPAWSPYCCALLAPRLQRLSFAFTFLVTRASSTGCRNCRFEQDPHHLPSCLLRRLPLPRTTGSGHQVPVRFVAQTVRNALPAPFLRRLPPQQRLHTSFLPRLRCVFSSTAGSAFHLLCAPTPAHIAACLPLQFCGRTSSRTRHALSRSGYRDAATIFRTLPWFTASSRTTHIARTTRTGFARAA